MGFLKKRNAPSELPNLAIEGLGDNVVKDAPQPVAVTPTSVAIETPVPAQPVVVAHIPEKKPVAGEDYLEVSHENTKGNASKELTKIDDSKMPKVNFFDEVLNDINDELKDVGKLEDWYEKKFVKEDVVSNMRGYWEGNKADIIIESFGAEYKKQINDKVKVLRELEEDWREIYFRLIKKEEEMKKEERELKETLSEFVNLCKRRKNSETKK